MNIAAFLIGVGGTLFIGSIALMLWFVDEFNPPHYFDK